MRCLDLDCGTGHATEIIERFVRPNGSVFGCDVSESMLDIAREKLSGPPINFPSGIKAFRKMSEKAVLKIDTLLEDSCVQEFAKGGCRNYPKR